VKAAADAEVVERPVSLVRHSAITVSPGCTRGCVTGGLTTLGHEEHLKEQQNQRKAAGKKSGIARAGGATKRRLFVKRAFGELTSLRQMQPNSANSMDDLEASYGRLLIKDGFDPERPPFKVSRETLRSDLKRLGIRSWLRPE
jgi:hypothetical protein